MLTTRISLDHLKAVSMFVSKESTRYYLNGVFVEMLPRGVRYVATDGHKLFAAYDELPKGDPDNTMLGSMIIPLDKCTAIKKQRTADFAIMTGSIQKPELGYLDSSLGFTPIDGCFPDWRRVLPESNLKTDDSVTFNTEYLHAFTKAGKLLDLGAPKWCVSGDAPAWVWFNSETAFGIIMPLRAKFTRDHEGRTAPDWINDKQPEMLQAAE